MATISPSEADALKALLSFLTAVLPPGVPAYLGQENRVPEPNEDDFVIYWPLRFTRLNTNIDSSGDVLYTASIAGTSLTVSDIDFGTITIGAPVYGEGVTAGTTILDQVSGEDGGVGVYTVSASQTVGSEVMASGIVSLEQHAKFTLQADVHGTHSADNSQIITTVFRDDAGIGLFTDARPQGDIVPLYTSDPRQMPFRNENLAVENRWVIELEIQMNQTIALGLQYSSAVEVGLINVDASFPPT